MPQHRSRRAGRGARIAVFLQGLTAVLVAALALAACTGGSSTPKTTATGAGGPAVPLNGPAQQLKDLAYATASPAQKLDLYIPERTAGIVPLVINIHGGGWYEGDKSEADELWNLERLNGDGVAVASINYRLSGEAPFPAGVQDARTAVRWLRANAAHYAIDPNKIALSGSSAGGNIAALVGVTGSLRTEFDDGPLGDSGVKADVRSVVSIFGVADMLTMDKQSQAQGNCPGPFPFNDLADSPESTWLGFPIQERPEETAKASPISYLGKASDVPPFWLVHGTADCTVPYAQSQEFEAALKKAGVPVDLQLVDGAGHGDPKVFEQGAEAAIKFLESSLY